jgi:membrane-associated protease RseP (regulator of RpoE activity)
MSFALTIAFYALVFLIVFLNRKKFEVYGRFMYLYRTKIGIRFMDCVAEKARKFVRFLGYFGIAVGFGGMIVIICLILLSAYNIILDKPGASGASPVIPGLPIAGTGLVFPLVTGWIVIFIIMVVHEFSHGIVASAHKIKIKNSGIAFFGPILGAFVEPDEKSLVKQKDSLQHSVFAAGPFANLFMVLIVMLISAFILAPIGNLLSMPVGVVVYSQPGFPAEIAGMENGTVITGINGQPISTVAQFKKSMEDISPGKKLKLDSLNGTYIITTAENPDDPSKGYIGVWILGEKSELKNKNTLNQILLSIFNWFGEMFGWLAFLSLNIGLINLLPIFITDGARMLKVFLERVIKNKEKSASTWLFVNWVSVALLLVLVFMPLLRWLNTFLVSFLI